MTQPSRTHFKKTMLATLIGAALLPQSGWAALDLAQSPPGTVEPYVAPNVIISVDDSGSMDYRLDAESESGATNNTTPNGGGEVWKDTSRRINVLKYALGKVFRDTTLLPENKIRLAWQVMWNNGNSPNAKSVDSANFNTNSMKVMTEAHRSNFLSFVNSLSANNGTPSHLMFSQADNYMRRSLSKNGPWAFIPGEQAEPYLGCRRNYHIMMTDGRWNSNASGGSQDDRTFTLPDGTQYTNSAQTNLYRDGVANTLADWAFKSWADTLQPSLYDKTNSEKQVPLTREYRRAPATEDFGLDGKKKMATLEKYWNPKYDPASWNHMVTYTIGFSAMSYTWPGASTIVAPTSMVPFGYDGTFPDFVTGNKNWPAMSAENVRALDLWHAALNGRGRFFAVRQGQDLEAAFRLILQQINTDSEPDRSSVATSGNNITRDSKNMFVANYDPQKAWKGWLTGETVDLTGASSAIPGWAGRTTADWLDLSSFNPSTRLVMTWGDKAGQGVAFEWATDESKLSTAQKNALNKKADGTTDTLGQDRLNFIRGDRTKERSGTTSTQPFRARQSRQGDIVNSSVWYVPGPVSTYADNGYREFVAAKANRPAMLYVGGNDGMLHGFAAADGTEKLAYVPRGVIPNLTRLTDLNYDNTHRYFVDGSPFSGDINLSSDPNAPNWRTNLVGSLGGGGKGYFVLDVTNPGSDFVAGNERLVVLADRTEAVGETRTNCTTITDTAARTACIQTNEEKDDIGHIYSAPVIDDSNSLRTPQITRLNNGRWAVIMGNGYNSINQRPVLLIQYLDGNRELQRIVAQTNPNTSVSTNDNGLSTPRLVDINGDGRTDVVYAGDLRGNMWKFIIASPDANTWTTAFSGVPLYTATGMATSGASTRSAVQSITAPPTVRANDRMMNVTDDKGKVTSVRAGGMMVAFGTGRNVTRADPESIAVQTLYAVQDNTRYKLYKLSATAKEQYVAVCDAVTDDVCKITTDQLPAPVTSSDKLAKRLMQTTGKAGASASEGRTFWAQDDDNSTDVDYAKHKGWYMDLPATSERLLKQMSFYDGSNILAVYSQVPAKGSNDTAAANVESCKLTSVDDERQYLTLVNIMDGERPSVQIMDRNGDGLYNASDDKVSRMTISKGAQTMIIKGNKIINRGSKQDDVFARLPEQSLRPTWRQLR